jgi:dihydroorotase
MISIEGLIISHTGKKRGRIEIDEATGLISKVSEPIGIADKVFDSELIFPGFIDLHVHAREDASHTHDYKEDFKTAGEAAINGGVVAFAEMPNNPIPPIDDKKYEEKKELTEKSPVPILLYAAIGTGTKPLSRTVPYKVFMGKSIGDMYFNSKEELEATLKDYRGCSISFHCEDPKIMDAHTDELTHEARRPAEAEWSALDTAIYLIEKYELHGKICHASTVEGIEKIKKAKARGIDITVEVTPHHLYFDETMFAGDLRKKLQVNPPIRQTKENRLALIEALRNGTIDYLATDHAPHTIEEKESGTSGMPHIDTYGTFTTWLMAAHDFTPQNIARACSKNPGDYVNQFLPEQYGEIKEGYVGSLTVIDTHKKILIKNEDMKTKCGWSPFEGLEFPGKKVMTIIKGKVYAD